MAALLLRDLLLESYQEQQYEYQQHQQHQQHHRSLTEWDGNPTEAVQKTLAILPKIACSLSFLGSGYIVYDALSCQKRTTYHRLLLGMSTCDMIVSVSFFQSSWAMPSDTPNVFQPVGNQQTCSAQGFFSQLGLATVFYNAMLALYYVLAIRRGIPNEVMAKKYEWRMHAGALLPALGTMIAGLSMGLFNFGLWDCWISASPLGCVESWQSTTTNPGTCTRGDNATLYQWAFYYAPTWFCILFVTFCMVRVHQSVLSRERAVDRWNIDGEQRRKHSKRIARQGYAYVGAFFLTIAPATVTRLWWVIGRELHVELLILIAATLPLQGFWNALVYLRPRYLKHRSEQRKKSRSKSGNLPSNASRSAFSGSFEKQDTKTAFVSTDESREIGVKRMSLSKEFATASREFAIPYSPSKQRILKHEKMVAARLQQQHITESESEEDLEIAAAMPPPPPMPSVSQSSNISNQNPRSSLFTNTSDIDDDSEHSESLRVPPGERSLPLAEDPIMQTNASTRSTRSAFSMQDKYNGIVSSTKARLATIRAQRLTTGRPSIEDAATKVDDEQSHSY